MLIFYGPINFYGELVKNYSTESKHYLSGWEFLLCHFTILPCELGCRKPLANFGISYRASRTMHGPREPQTAAEKLSQNIAKRWRMDETRARMGGKYFAFLSTRRETGVKQSRDRRARITILICITGSG